ncbi:MAG: extracellular solute-binding protein [Bacillota bacterium]|jgi:ABC-type glycerol-3-phosphate transport system substrate-binding protein|nr:extracellular solute-binding protein [Bacillota bacterium]HHT89740.1 extracellular solute-binding protein [Bacillota bacterium]
MSKKMRVLSLVGLLMLSLVMSAAAMAAPKTLKVTAEAWYFNKYEMEEAARRFQEDHPDVDFEWSKAGDFEVAPLMLAWSRDRYIADLVIVASPSEAVAFQARDLLLSFDDVLVGEYAKENWLKGFLDQCTIGGQVYALPSDAEVMTLIGRRDFAEEAGLTDDEGNIIMPKDFDELYSFLEQLTIKDSSGKTTRYGMTVNWSPEYTHYVYFSGLQAMRGSIFDENGALDFSSDEALELLTFWQKGVEEGLISTSSLVDHSGPRNDMKSGLAAILWEDHARVIEIGQVVGQDKMQIVKIPGADVNGTVSYTMSLMIPKNAAHPELAKAFVLEQFNAEWFAHDLMDRWGKLLGLKSNIESRLDDPIWETVFELADNSVGLPKTVDHAKMVDIMTAEIHNMLKMQQTPSQTLANIRQQIQPLNLEPIE